MSSSFEPREFNSLYLFASALLCPFISFLFFLPTMPVVLRRIMVDVTEMAAAPREEEEEEGED